MSKIKNVEKPGESHEFTQQKPKELPNEKANPQTWQAPYMDETSPKMVQKIYGKPIQKPIEKSMPKSVQKPFGELSPKRTEKLVVNLQKSIENSIPNAGKKLIKIDSPIEKPISKTGEKFFLKSTVKSIGYPNGQQSPIQKPTGKSVLSPKLKPFQKLVGMSIENSSQKPMSKPATKPVQKAGENVNIHKAQKTAKRANQSARKLLHKDVFKKIDYSAIELEIVFLINQFPDMIAEYQKLRDQLKPDELEGTIKTDPKTNLRALERWSASVFNGQRVANYKASCPIMSECSNAIGYFYDYDLYSELSRSIGSSQLLQELQGALMSQTSKSVRMLMRLRMLFLHLSPSIADQDQFCSEILLEAITEMDHILAFDLIAAFELYNDKCEDNVQLIFKQGGQLEDTRRMMMDVDMDFIRSLANELDVYIHSIKCFVDYMKKNANFIPNLSDIIEKGGSSAHQ